MLTMAFSVLPTWDLAAVVTFVLFIVRLEKYNSTMRKPFVRGNTTVSSGGFKLPELGE